MRRARILIIEDLVALAAGWARCLTRSGFEVRCAHTLRDAETVVERMEFDVVFLDLNLPDGAGSDLLSVFEQLDNPPAVCVVSGAIDAERAIEVGGRCNLVIPKPVRSSVLDEVARRMQLKTIPSGWVAKFCRLHQLSPAESVVLKAAANRTRDKEIACMLGCSPSTVRTYWLRIFGKTGCRPQKAVLCALLDFAAMCV